MMYESARRQFESEITEHEITIIHDDGLYRHLRFAKPGTGIWSWNLITWPGHLAVAGDVGDGWSFARIPDMFEFFHVVQEPYRINPDYWWQKMPSQLRDAGKHYSEDKLKQIARDLIGEWDLAVRDREAALAQLDHEWDWVNGEHEQRDLVDRFAFVPTITTSNISGQPLRFSDTWEWEAQDFDHHFLLACFCIVWGIEKYRAVSS